jgi:hypothetical protein
MRVHHFFTDIDKSEGNTSPESICLNLLAQGRDSKFRPGSEDVQILESVAGRSSALR